MDDQAPDFAMTRAVEILVQLYEKQRHAPVVPPAPFDRVVQLFNETIAFDVTKTTRGDVERALGVAFSYPARGWHTYCVRGPSGKREFLSAFYRSPGLAGDALVSVELYVPKTDRAPSLEPRNLGGFRLVPSEIAIGAQDGTLPDSFSRVEKPDGFGPYEAIFEARFPGGVVYAMSNGGAIERLALYALKTADATER